MKIEWDYGDYEGLTHTQIREIAPCWLISGRAARAAKRRSRWVLR